MELETMRPISRTASHLTMRMVRGEGVLQSYSSTRHRRLNHSPRLLQRRPQTASFIYSNNASATIHRIAYDSNAITMTISPINPSQATPSTSSPSTAPSPSPYTPTTHPRPRKQHLTWPVTPQPWRHGDKIMLRISQANP